LLGLDALLPSQDLAFEALVGLLLMSFIPHLHCVLRAFWLLPDELGVFEAWLKAGNLALCRRSWFAFA